ncbi:hypothetical protein D3C73_1331050 [compost metagenome]
MTAGSLGHSLCVGFVLGDGFAHIGPGEEAGNQHGAGGGGPAGVPTMSGMPTAAHRGVQFRAAAGPGLAVQGAQIPGIVFVERGAIGNAHALLLMVASGGN